MPPKAPPVFPGGQNVMSLVESRDQTLGPALEKGRFLTEHRRLKDVVSAKRMPLNWRGQVSSQNWGPDKFQPLDLS